MYLERNPHSSCCKEFLMTTLNPPNHYLVSMKIQRSYTKTGLKCFPWTLTEKSKIVLIGSLCCIFFFSLKESVVTVKEDELLRNQCKPDLPSVLPTWASDIEQAAAIESRDFVASVFVDVLNSFVGVPSACDNNIVEDTLVHTYLHALLHALFAKDAPFGHKRFLIKLSAIDV
ncbi:hypothetical protein BDB00DRAFT_787408 [Zychaea mexicana]|uniref:uncharacterized protein n=1 Tax=Zychaea mexicana TaxID=64656 RepID=UPI0022FE6AC1|nr:uncharacterized protein BDB00DRAFT_787408 [Zychaea mexicana]KAI9494199.1 hypothetical protein BDB00DRAFT_787408 [Zychaea mexicana]